jgi:hypothetical protein
MKAGFDRGMFSFFFWHGLEIVVGTKVFVFYLLENGNMYYEDTIIMKGGIKTGFINTVAKRFYKD